MIKEAQLRLTHNKQRQRLKQLLQTASDGGPTVKTGDLLLACQLAKMPIDQSALLDSKFGYNRDYRGSPKTVVWKGFHESLAYPKLTGPGYFGELPPLRAVRLQQAKMTEAAAATPTAGAEVATASEATSDEQIHHHWTVLKRLMETRFSEMRRAFRLIDEDASGSCDRNELKFMLNAMFNLSIPDDVLDRLIDLADFDGDGQINFAEFCRMMTAENVLKMKNTLQADVSNFGRVAPDKGLAVDYGDVAAMNRKMASGGYEDGTAHVKLRRTGPGIQALRKAHATYKKAILSRYPTIKDAFKAIDADGSGTVRRSELARFLGGMSKAVPSRVIGSLIDFCDSDGDAKTLSIEEFTELMEAETLGAGGYDPNAPGLQKK